MRRLFATMLIVAGALVSTLTDQPPVAGSEGGQARIASAVIDRWAAAYTANNVDAVVSNYTSDVILLGTSHPISLGTAGVREYFSRIPNSGNKVVVKDRTMVVLADGVVQATGFYEFTLNYTGKPVQVPGRFTMIIVKRGSNWLIEHHHSSPIPK
jgi:uncharacterized protein (TIGR02246 family)